jgi:predicted nucleic acid-binding protein
MPVFAPDTSCMVPALLRTHPHHARAATALNRHLDVGDRMVVVAHTLLETYSVLTRLPRPHRVSASVALRAIEDTFLTKAEVVALRHEQYVHLLYDLVRRETVGGQVFDAAIVACARLAGVDVILTFNERHFRRFEGDGLEIEVP